MDKQPKLSESEVIIINCDEDNSQLVPKKNKNGKKEKKRKVKIDSSDNKRLIITQKVKKQKFQCIINFENICKHKHESKVIVDSFQNKKSKKKSEDLRSNSISERMTPCCMRTCCHSAKTINYRSRPKNRSTKKVSTIYFIIQNIDFTKRIINCHWLYVKSYETCILE